MTTEPAPAEDQDRERADRAEIDRLNAKPWRGGCPACPMGMLYCADTEEEARRLVSDHIAKRHHLPVPHVWRDHDDPTPEPVTLEPAALAAADARMAVDPDGKLKPVSEFSADERWWCDGEECGEDRGYPHVHTYGSRPTRRVDLETGWEIPETTAKDQA